jgi:hypothetical protein
MIWLHPLAWLGALAVGAPLLIHLLVHRRAQILLFPTLRFLEPTRRASIRRHRLDDVSLLLVRGAVLTVATAAFAGPVLITSARRAAWDTRVVRAVVTESSSEVPVRAESESAFRATVIDTADLKSGIRRGVAWLDDAPPARRELVVVSAFPLSSISSADIRSVPEGVGIRFVRVGDLPARRTLGGLATLGPAITGEPHSRPALPAVASRHDVSVVLDGPRTSVSDAAAGTARIPIEIDVPQLLGETASAALDAVLSQRVPAPAPGRRARLVVQSSPGWGGSAQSINEPWMADAVAAIARDKEFQGAASRVEKGIGDRRFALAPWLRLANANDGHPLAAAAAGPDVLLVATAAPVADLSMALLVRALFSALAPAPPETLPEVVAISDAQLTSWQRPAAPISEGRFRTVERDDRRWLWAAVLVLLAVETLLRRTRTLRNAEFGMRNAEGGLREDAHVA